MTTAPAPSAPDYRSALLDTLAVLGARVRTEGTGGGCEAIVVGPLDNGAVLMLTDGDAGVPTTTEQAEEYAAGSGGWLVQTFPHAPCGECSVCDYPPFVFRAGDLTAEGALTAARAALSGRDDR